MPPLILHNVPDDELYIGEDGIQRPYAMLFPGAEGQPSRPQRRVVAETGSFGKSTRRSRSRTGTPAAVRREDPTLAAADAIFSAFLANKESTPVDSVQRKGSLSGSISQPNLGQGGSLNQVDNTAVGSSSRYVHKEPTEVILRGFNYSQAYAAIREYEAISGRICEDYPRDAPGEQRKYKSDLRDQASLRRKPLTAEEKVKAFKFAGGNHWIKVTFESAEAAAAAIECSPQTIHGYLVYAETYRGIPPTADEAVPATILGETQSNRGTPGGQGRSTRRGTSGLSKSFTTPSLRGDTRGGISLSPPESHTSSNTMDSDTISNTTTTASSATVTGFATSSSTSTFPTSSSSQTFCAKIPTAKRMTILPAEQALLPQKSYSQRVISNIPLIGWFTGDIIGNAVPRTDNGDFDWGKASFYWKFMWWIDSWTGLFDIAGGEKED